MIFATTPSQTVGPYFAIGLPWPGGPFTVPEGTPGAIVISGTVLRSEEHTSELQSLPNLICRLLLE